MLRRARLLSALFLIALLAPGAMFVRDASAAATDGHWVELGPPARQEHTLVYDALNHRLVLFGGRSNAASNAVFFLDLTTNEWSHIEAAGTPPTARYGHVAVYDPLRQRMVVFGGHDGAVRNDAWALSLDATPTWTELSPAGAPPAARYRCVGAYDSLLDRLLVHGGDGGAGVLDDTWSLSFAGGGTWSVITPAGSPAPARAQHAGAYDPVRDRLLVFGGSGASGLLGDAWALDLATDAWAEIAATGGPPTPRRQAAGVYDPEHDAFLVIGGFEAPLPVADTWALSLDGTPAWTQKASPGCYALAACWVAPLHGAVAHGGYNQSFTHTGTTLLDPGMYSSVNTLVAGGPWLRRALDGIFDPARARLVMFGGDLATGFDPSPTDATWSMQPGPPFAWTLLSQWTPRARAYHTLTYDPPGDRMILYAGDAIYGAGTSLDDTWSFDLATDAWSELTFAGPIPGPHQFHTSVYDPVGRRMIVFGGIVDNDFSNELWQLDLSGTPAWSPLAASGTPPAPRALHAAVYDPAGRRMLVFDGSGAFTYPPLPASFNDLWELSLDGPPAWRQLAPGGTSPGGAYQGWWRAISDPARHRALFFGPGGAHQLTLTDPPGWAPLVTTGPAATSVAGQPLVYDPAADRLLVFGGNFSDATLALELDPVGTVSVPFATSGPSFVLRRVSPNPARTSVTVGFDLPRAGRVSMELIDVAGRRVADRAVSVLPGGRHDLALPVPRSAAPGIYFVRLAFEGRVAHARIALIR